MFKFLQVKRALVLDPALQLLPAFAFGRQLNYESAMHGLPQIRVK